MKLIIVSPTQYTLSAMNEDERILDIDLLYSLRRVREIYVPTATSVENMTAMTVCSRFSGVRDLVRELSQTHGGSLPTHVFHSLYLLSALLRTLTLLFAYAGVITPAEDPCARHL